MACRRKPRPNRHRVPACRSFALLLLTQARQSGISDAEIAMLIGDKTGPAIIAHIYGDVRPDYLLAQAQSIRLTVSAGTKKPGQGSSIESSDTVPQVSAGSLWCLTLRIQTKWRCCNRLSAIQSN